MRLNRRALAVIAASAAALVAVTVASTAAAPGDPVDPATAPHPQYDYDDPSKSFLVELNFGATSATLIDASVVGHRSRSRIGDPPLLQLSLTDEDGAAAGTLQAWDPRWYLVQAPAGGEELELRDGPGILTLPFDADAASMLVRDLRAGTDLVTVDLSPAVREFCLAHPSDPDCVEADLAITSTTVSGDPLGVIGKPVAVQVKAAVANLGPDGPVDADVTQTASGSPGVTVTPANRTFDADGLAVGSPTTVTGDYNVVCTTAGAQTVTVTTSVVPEKAKVADLHPANNSASATFSIDCAVPVTVNVMPGSLTNPVNVNPGAVPMAVLTTAAGEYGNPLAFDAATIQAATVRVGVRGPLIATSTGAPETHGKVHLEDSLELDEQTRDGDKDGVLHVRADQLGIQPGTVEICVRGRSGPGAGTSFFGCDHITLVPR
ncbi:hypothetical protein [Catellatospora sichuanensis]|uniref:hypothetical protein n=1 Tax=Catellatospora sichuanensis TaxID=1969805 RepID=UPI00118457D1|nr:hypothetical protein [Catellatospora sichuanensis]